MIWKHTQAHAHASAFGSGEEDSGAEGLVLLREDVARLQRLGDAEKDVVAVGGEKQDTGRVRTADSGTCGGRENKQ